jgi:DNA-binding GntR family transcriptional regulator
VASIPAPPEGQHVEVVHDEVRQRILCGALKPGEGISQVRLSKELGISRTPLREALRLLQREGLVEWSMNRQYRVAGFTLGDMEELYISRLVLEAAGIRITTPLLTPEEIAGLEAEMARMAHFADLEDYERWQVPHRAFHRALVCRAGDRLTMQLQQLSDHAERYRRLYTTEGPRAWSVGVNEHRGILDAVKDGNADAAAARLVDHLSHTVTSVIEMVDASHDASRLRTAMAVASAPLGANR